MTFWAFFLVVKDELGQKPFFVLIFFIAFFIAYIYNLLLNLGTPAPKTAGNTPLPPIVNDVQ